MKSKKVTRLKKTKSLIHQTKSPKSIHQSTHPGPWMLTPRPLARASVMVLDILLTPLGICHFSPQHIKKRQSAKHMDVLGEKSKANSLMAEVKNRRQALQVSIGTGPFRQGKRLTHQLQLTRSSLSQSSTQMFRCSIHTENSQHLPKVQILSTSRRVIKWTISKMAPQWDQSCKGKCGLRWEGRSHSAFRFRDGLRAATSGAGVRWGGGVTGTLRQARWRPGQLDLVSTHSIRVKKR